MNTADNTKKSSNKGALEEREPGSGKERRICWWTRKGEFAGVEERRVLWWSEAPGSD